MLWIVWPADNTASDEEEGHTVNLNGRTLYRAKGVKEKNALLSFKKKGNESARAALLPYFGRVGVLLSNSVLLPATHISSPLKKKKNNTPLYLHLSGSSRREAERWKEPSNSSLTWGKKKWSHSADRWVKSIALVTMICLHSLKLSSTVLWTTVKIFNTKKPPKRCNCTPILLLLLFCCRVYTPPWHLKLH